MNLRDLRYLVALIEHRHFGRAAEACFVSQPALSMQIKKLEETLGVTLLERTNKQVMLTDIGKRIGEQAQQILRQVDEMQETAKREKDPYRGEIKIGVIPTLAPYLLPKIVPIISKKFPKLSIFLIEEQTSYLLEKLKNGKLDAALLALPLADEKLKSHALFSEEFMLAVPKKHVLAKQKTVKAANLQNESLLLLEEGHCLREQSLSFCHRMKVKENKDFRATSLETLRHMVAAGVGMTLMPKLACRSNDGVAYIPFHSPKPERIIALCYRETNAKRDLLRELADIISS